MATKCIKYLRANLIKQVEDLCNNFKSLKKEIE